MIYLITASKDTTAYSLYPTINTGLDQILVVSKGITKNDENDIARSFLKFEIDSLPTYVTASLVELSLQISQIEQIPLSYTIYANPISESWDMGIGQWEDNLPYTGSLSWNHQPQIVSSISSSQYFNFEDGDIKMDVKSIYNHWTQSGNFGLRLAHSESIESSSLNYGYLKFYSKETNTFRQPLLKIGFDDQQYVTGSLLKISEEDEIIIKTKSLKESYPIGKLVKFNFFTREKYPVKTITNSFPVEQIKYIPQSSYYAIKDILTGISIVDFCDFTKISCNESGSYIKLDTTNFPINRPLRFEYLINRNGIFEKYFDDKTFIIN